MVVIAAIVINEADDVALARGVWIILATAPFTGSILRIGRLLAAELLIVIAARS